MVPSLAPWNVPPSSLSLLKRDVHVWRASFHQLGALYDSFEEVISKDEQAKAHRYKFEDNRREYIIARGFLRFLLGGYLKESPGSLRFFYNPYGKPALMPGNGSGTINFNLSHAPRLCGVRVYTQSRGRHRYRAYSS